MISGQLLALQGRFEIVAGRVGLEVFADAHVGIDAALRPLILGAGRQRGNLQHEVRRFAVFPDLVGRTVVVGGAKHDEHIGGDDRLGIIFFVVDEHVAGHIDIGPVREEGSKRIDRIDQRVELEIAFRHGFSIGVRVKNRRVRQSVAIGVDGCHRLFLRAGRLKVNTASGSGNRKGTDQ